MSEEKGSEILRMEHGKYYDILGVRPEDMVFYVYPKSGSNLLAMAKELETLAKYSKDEESFNFMSYRVLNEFLSAGVKFPPKLVKETEQGSESPKGA
jgi:hypothetical protein